MSTTGTRSAIARAGLEHVVERGAGARARVVAAAWITGPSASGSENGTPSSTRSAPPSA